MLPLMLILENKVEISVSSIVLFLCLFSNTNVVRNIAFFVANLQMRKSKTESRALE